MQWLRLHWKSCLRVCTSDSYEESRLLTWSTSISVQPKFCSTRLSDLFKIRLHDDDVQDFDTRWDQALLAASERPKEMVLEGLYKSKLQDSVQLQTVLSFNDQRIFETTNNHPIPDWRHPKDVKLTKRWERGTSESRTKLWREERQPKKKEKLSLRGKWENAISGKANGQCLERRLM